MDEKKCNKCGEVKPISEFHKDKSNRTGYYSSCKDCKSKYMAMKWKNDQEYRNKKSIETKSRREYFRKYMEDRRKDPEYREKARLYMVDYWEKNDAAKYARDRRNANPEIKERERVKAIKYRKNNPEKSKEINKKYNEKRRKTPEYKEWRNEYEKIKRDNDPKYRAMISCRNRMNKIVLNKINKSEWFIGCNKIELFEHIEKQFRQNMSWENYGSYWHIDHIIPCNFFDLTKIEEQMICFNYRNLQPLTVSENCSKQDGLPDNADALYSKIKAAIMAAKK